jgi:hypothetical protein
VSSTTSAAVAVLGSSFSEAGAEEFATAWAQATEANPGRQSRSANGNRRGMTGIEEQISMVAGGLAKRGTKTEVRYAQPNASDIDEFRINLDFLSYTRTWPCRLVFG